MSESLEPQIRRSLEVFRYNLEVTEKELEQLYAKEQLTYDEFRRKLRLETDRDELKLAIENLERMLG